MSSTPLDIEGRLHRLMPRLQELPPASARPLTIAGRFAGWASAGAQRHMRGFPGLHFAEQSVHIEAAEGGLNRTLARLAHHLHEAGCLRSWRNEELDVIGEGQCLGRIERGAMRALGLLTRAVHLNAWSADGHLWLARRSPTKSTDPNLWDTLVGGLVGAGETLDDALVRESHEEAGLTPAALAQREPLRLITRVHVRLPEGYQAEDTLASDCLLADDVQPRNLDGEVSEIRRVGMNELARMLADDVLTSEAELVVLDSLRRRVAAGAALSA